MYLSSLMTTLGLPICGLKWHEECGDKITLPTQNAGFGWMGNALLINLSIEWAGGSVGKSNGAGLCRA